MSWLDNLKYSANYAISRARIHDIDSSELDDILSNRNFVGIINWQIVKNLIAPYEELQAYKLGYIDKKGFPTNKPVKSKDKKHYSYFIKSILQLRRKLEKLVPKQQLTLALQQLLLIREDTDNKFIKNNKEIFDILGRILPKKQVQG